jgi:hypothetical protein
MLLSFFPSDVWMDEDGNLHYLIQEKDGKDPIVQFCSHMDTACTYVERVNIMRTGDMIHTDGRTVLSADCKIGVAIMLKMIEARVPGWYVFHVGEEKGCIGATALAKKPNNWIIEPKISIEFDRHSYGSIITHQCMTRCCSEKFSEALAKQLIIPGYQPYQSDDGGLYTDNYEYESMIPEVTNISVGYFGHHTNRERQDITYANLLLKALLKVNWHKLPVVRDPNDPANSRWGGHGYSLGRYGNWGYDKLGKWGSETKDLDPWETEDNYDGTGADTILGKAKSSDYIFPRKPEVVKTEHGYTVKCCQCQQLSEFTNAEMESPFKFCLHCDGPLDADTAEELQYLSDTFGVKKESR